jgi:hypothetical protein
MYIRKGDQEMTEGTPLTLEQLRRLNRDLMEKVLDKAQSDPEWKQRLLDDPEAAIAEAGFLEVHEIQQMQEASAQLPTEEVRGHQFVFCEDAFTAIQCLRNTKDIYAPGGEDWRG